MLKPNVDRLYIGSIHSQITLFHRLCHKQGGVGQLTRAMAVELGDSVQ